MNAAAWWLQMVGGGLQQLLAPATATHRAVETLSPAQGLCETFHSTHARFAELLEYRLGQARFEVHAFPPLLPLLLATVERIMGYLAVPSQFLIKVGEASALPGNSERTWQVGNLSEQLLMPFHESRRAGSYRMQTRITRCV